MTVSLPLTPHADGCVLAVQVTPKAAKDLIGAIETDAAGKVWLRVRVTTAPEDGKATRAVIKLLSKQWKIPASSITVISGETSRQKRLLLHAAFDAVARRLAGGA